MRTLPVWCSRAGRLVLVVLLALLTGCASAKSGGWTKPGMTEEQLNQDTMRCLGESQEIVPGRDGPSTRIDQDRYRWCMEKRGYTAGSAK